MTRRDILWKDYYRAMKAGNGPQAQQILNQIHTAVNPKQPKNPNGRCAACRKKF